MAALRAGPIDARRSLVVIGCDAFEAAYGLHEQAMAPSAPVPWVVAARRADFAKLVARVPGFFVMIDGQRAGYLQVLSRQRDLHIVNIGLGWRHQGKGHGSRLMRWLQQAARERACGLHLKTYHSNPRALAFYQRHGFVVTQRDARHIWLDWPGQGAPAPG